jgi:sulfate adenylyltransferase
MYALARDGQLTGFTGIDDPYEPPHNPEITIDTVRCSAQENTERIVSYLIDQGFVRPSVYIGDADPEIIEDEEELVRVS